MIEAGLATSVLDAERQPLAVIRAIFDFRNFTHAVALMNGGEATALAKYPVLAAIVQRVGRATHDLAERIAPPVQSDDAPAAATE